MKFSSAALTLALWSSLSEDVLAKKPTMRFLEETQQGGVRRRANGKKSSSSGGGGGKPLTAKPVCLVPGLEVGIPDDVGDNGVISEDPRGFVAGADFGTAPTEGDKSTWDGFGLTIDLGGGFEFAVPFPTKTLEVCQSEYDDLLEEIFVHVAEVDGVKILPLEPTYTLEEREDIQDASEDWQDCLSSEGYIVEPFRLNQGQFGVTHEITSDEGSTLGSKALKLTLDPTTSSAPPEVLGSSKIFIEYYGDTAYDEPVADLASIQIDFKYDAVTGSACDSGNTCFNQIYVGVYTRSSDTSTVFYDCQLTFSVKPLADRPDSAIENLEGSTIGERGEWHRLTILPTTVATTIRADSGDTQGSTACVNSATTLGDLGTENYVLGTGPFSGAYLFAINGGDTNAAGTNDQGLILFVDNISYVYDSETVVYDFE